MQRGQKEFHLCHSLVLRIVWRRIPGGARTCVFATTLMVPPGPWVGTEMGERREAVTGVDGVMGELVGG